MQILYRIIYSPSINRILRFVNKALLPLLPDDWTLPPAGTIHLHLDNFRFALRTNQTSFVGRLLYYQGPSKFEYTSIFKELVRQCRTFIDVGANFGYYSVLGGKMAKEISIHAFEPSPGPHHFLQENITINNLQAKVIPHREALSNRSGTIDFVEVVNPKYRYLQHNLGGVGRTGHENPSEKTRKIQVAGITLDEFYQKHRLKVDLIKMDTEGTEDKILEGATKLIESQKPIIICETLYDKIESKLESIMMRHGYLFFNHVSGKLVRVDTIVRTKDDGVRDCFFVHPEKQNLIAPFL